MKLQYSEVATFIEHIIDDALSEGISISSLGELHAHLDNNLSSVIEIVEEEAD